MNSNSSTRMPRRWLRSRKLAAVPIFTMIAALLVTTAPASAVTITTANDIDIVQVVLNDNGTVITQNSSQSGVIDADDDQVEIIEVTLDDNGTPVVLSDWNVGSLDVTNISFPTGLTGVGTYENGSYTPLSDPGFEAAAERVLDSLDLRDYLAYDGLNMNSTSWGHDFDVIFQAPLTNDDYVFVAERFGNTFFDLIPLDVNGNPIAGAEIIGFDAPYAWNTGYAPTDQLRQPIWFTAADVSNFNVDTDVTPIWGFRVDNNGQADVKFWGATPEAPSSIAGTVLDDLGAPIAGVTITLTGTDNTGAAVTLTATTDANGDYLFADLAPGTYTVAETQPAGYGDTTDVVGSEGGTLGNDVISDIVLTGGTDAVDYDFIETYASIAGTVVVDQNNDGVADAGEAPIAGVTVTLTGTDVNGTSVTATTMTDADGNYLFDGLLAGDYTVTETQPPAFDDGLESAGSEGGTVSDDEISAITLGAGVDAVDYDFTELEPPLDPASLAGSVYVDGTNAPIEGVMITLTGTDVDGDPVSLTTLTDADGNYIFEDLVPGEYTVTETQPAGYGDSTDAVGSEGGTLADDEISAIELEAGVDATAYDFGETLSSIAGSVEVDDGTPIAGVEITLTGTDVNGVAVSMTVFTDANGEYIFEDLLEGTYTVTETQPIAFLDAADSVGSEGGTLDNDSISEIPLGAGVGAVDYDFVETNPAGFLSGNVSVDNGDPIEGVVIQLLDDTGAVVATTTTDANGDYLFTDLELGDYTVTELQPDGYGNVTPNTIADITVPVSGVTDVDFVETLASIAGTVAIDQNNDGVADAGEMPIEGVEIALAGTDVNGIAVTATTLTGADGNYIFEDLLAGDYTVTETQPAQLDDGLESAGSTGGTVADDEISEISLPAGTDSVGNDFTETYPPASIAGSVAVDTGDPIEGVVIVLAGTDVNGDPVSLTTTTDADGNYSFEDLFSGVYTITETQPAGFGDGTDTVGSEGGTPTNDRFSEITLSAGTDATGYDFEETLASISGSVIIDQNNNGAADLSELPIEGVTITLTGTDVNDEPVTVTTTTDADGNYSFEGLLAGTYTVTEDQPADFVDGLEVAGSTGGTVADDEISEIELEAGTDSIENDFAELYPPASIAGSVETDAGAPIEGVEITLTGTDYTGNLVTLVTTTAANGDYIFADLLPGTYTVTETQPAAFADANDVAGSEGGTLGNDVVSEVALDPGVDATGYDFIETPAALSGSVTVEGTNAPLEGVVIELRDTNGVLITTTTTDADGNYAFAGLAAGDYEVTQLQPDGYGNVTPNVLDVTIPTDGLADVDFVESVGSIAGVVVDENGVGIAGVVLTLTGVDTTGAPVALTTTTDADGEYIFENLLEGTYTIGETQPAGYVDGIDTPGSTGGNNSVNDSLTGIALVAGVNSVANNFAEEVIPPPVTTTTTTTAPVTTTTTPPAVAATTTTATPAINGSLAITGVESGALGAFAGLLVLAGAAMLAGARRKD